MFGIGIPELSILVVILFFVILPFIINYRLAKSRGKDVALMMLLTFIFSWLVTLILVFLPTIEEDAVKANRNV